MKTLLGLLALLVLAMSAYAYQTHKEYQSFKDFQKDPYEINAMRAKYEAKNPDQCYIWSKN